MEVLISWRYHKHWGTLTEIIFDYGEKWYFRSNSHPTNIIECNYEKNKDVFSLIKWLE